MSKKIFFKEFIYKNIWTCCRFPSKKTYQFLMGAKRSVKPCNFTLPVLRKVLKKMHKDDWRALNGCRTWFVIFSFHLIRLKRSRLFFIPETTIMSIFVQSYQIEYLKAILCAPREFSLLRHSRTKWGKKVPVFFLILSLEVHNIAFKNQIW